MGKSKKKKIGNEKKKKKKKILSTRNFDTQEQHRVVLSAGLVPFCQRDG